VGKELKII